jgi:hypothetical protein
MTKDEVTSVFTLAGFTVLKVWRLENKYWAMVPENYAICASNPWWLVRTEFGLIEIGWRKRVISIDWSDTSLSHEVTTDNVTKDNTSVHAAGLSKAVEYLTALRTFGYRPLVPPCGYGDD